MPVKAENFAHVPMFELQSITLYMNHSAAKHLTLAIVNLSASQSPNFKLLSLAVD